MRSRAVSPPQRMRCVSICRECKLMQDILDTYQSMPFVLQVLWLIVPPIFIAVVLAIVLFYSLAAKRMRENRAAIHPFCLDDKDIERIVAYAPPTPDAPLLIAVTKKKPPRQFKTTLTPSEQKELGQSSSLGRGA